MKERRTIDNNFPHFVKVRRQTWGVLLVKPMHVFLKFGVVMISKARSLSDIRYVKTADVYKLRRTEISSRFVTVYKQSDAEINLVQKLL